MPKRRLKTKETESVEKYKKNRDFLSMSWDDTSELMIFIWKNGNVFSEKMMKMYMEWKRDMTECLFLYFYSENMDELWSTMRTDMHGWVNLIEVDEKLVVLDDF
jgi:hypothetical protein